MIRDVTSADAAAIADIYNYYVLNDIATFEEQSVSEQQMAGRIQQVQRQQLPWLVSATDGQIRGYAYATHWKSRSAYRHSVEITVYADPQCAGQGVGSELYTSLFEKLRQLPVRTVLGGITLPNPASIALHEKFGMRKVAHLGAVGYKFGRWLDVGYWQVNLDCEPVTVFD